MFDKRSNMPEFQWKLSIVERNLVLSNWINLIPEAQEQMLWEADELMGDVPPEDRQRLLTSLEILQAHAEENLQQKIQQILSKHFSFDIREALEFNLENTTFTEAVFG